MWFSDLCGGYFKAKLCKMRTWSEIFCTVENEQLKCEFEHFKSRSKLDFLQTKLDSFSTVH